MAAASENGASPEAEAEDELDDEPETEVVEIEAVESEAEREAEPVEVAAVEEPEAIPEAPVLPEPSTNGDSGRGVGLPPHVGMARRHRLEPVAAPISLHCGRSRALLSVGEARVSTP